MPGSPAGCASVLVSQVVLTEEAGSLQGISEGMQPPSPLATTLTTLSCIGLVVWTFVSHGAATSGLAVMSFAVLSLQLLGTEKPRFSQLTSSVFGMFYCGARRYVAFRGNLLSCLLSWTVAGSITRSGLPAGCVIAWQPFST